MAESKNGAWENILRFGMGPKEGPDGQRAIGLPMGSKKLPAMAGDRGPGQRVQFKRDFNEMFCRVRNVELARVLQPALQIFEVCSPGTRTASLWRDLGRIGPQAQERRAAARRRRKASDGLYTPTG